MSEGPDSDLEALVADFYAAFDNRDGRSPAVDALRAMFDAAATITRVTPDQVDTWSPGAFIAPRQAMLTDGTLEAFHEWETQANTVVLRNIASRWSTYEKEGLLNGEDYRGGGHKFIQFVRRDGRWLISSILWEDF
ncbi:MAG TPA: hypothetical protein VGC92_04930 [Phenylobacterium sp.]|jgi:hypothetical protein